MAFWKYVRPGPGVAFVQKVSVTWPLEDEPLPLLLPPPAQAEAARATPRPSAAIAAVRVLFIIVETPRVNLRKTWGRSSDASPLLATRRTRSRSQTSVSKVNHGKWPKNSFWCGTFWIVTFRCAVWKAVMALTQTPLSGSAVALFHQLRVTRPPALELVDALEPAEVPLLLLHAYCCCTPLSWPLLPPPLWR